MSRKCPTCNGTHVIKLILKRIDGTLYEAEQPCPRCIAPDGTEREEPQDG